MSIYYTLLTDTGAAKYAYNDANALPTEFTEIALGDNNGNYFTPQVTDGDCVNEVYRANINSLTIDPVDDTTIIIELVIPANIGGFTIREARIYDADGIVIYTANTEAIPKPVLSEGMANDLRLQFRVTRANTSQVTLLVDPSITLASQTYVINAITTHNNDPNAHGAAAWATKVGVQNQQYSYAAASGSTTAYTATFNPAITALVDGTQVIIDTTSVGTNTTTTPTFSPNGLTARTIVKSNSALFIGDMPKRAILSYNAANTNWILLNPSNAQNLSTLDYPEIFTSNNRVGATGAAVAGTGGTVSIPSGVRILLGEELVTGVSGVMRTITTPAWTSANLLASSTYYLRAKFASGVFTPYVQRGTDSDTIPASLVGTIDGASGGGFDSTALDILLAKVVTGSAGTVPTVTNLTNKRAIYVLLTSGGSLANGVTRITLLQSLGWARRPNRIYLDLLDTSATVTYYVGAGRAETISRYSYSLSYDISSTGGSYVGRAGIEAV